MTGRGSLAALVAALVVSVAAAAPEPPGFHRVHVPAGRLGDVPLGGERYVPMPLADFDAAVARARAAAGAAPAEPAAPATAARWTAALGESGGLVGTIACDVGRAAAGPGRLLPLGGLLVRRALLAGDPPREAVVCGAGAGLAVAIPEAGTYEFDFTCAPEPGTTAFRLPLVPALATSLALELPPGLRPVLSGPAARTAVVSAAGPGGWRIDVGPAVELFVALEPRDAPRPGVAIWADVALSAPRADLAAAVVPVAPWRAGRFALDQDPSLRVTEVRAGDGGEVLDHVTAADGRAVSIDVPRWLEGTRTPIVVRGVAPATGAVWRLPLVEAGVGGWAGGGWAVRVDGAFLIRDAALTDCQVVAPEAAVSWPLPARAAETGAGPPPAAWHVEQQGPAAKVSVEIGPRAASFDVARVTTVDILPGSVRGRMACEARVTGGEAFEITGRVAPGWIIDAVDSVDWSTATDGVDAPTPARADRAVEWRVIPSPVGDTLRIGLARAATVGGGIGLRITGHRAGLAPGAAFTTSDVDMVRFEGEAADAAVVDLRTGADAFVEIDGRPAGWFEVPDRLAPLVEEGAPRGRIRGGDRAADVEARVVRRRPPLDVDVEVRLEAREETVVQTFTFDCRNAAGIESLVVDFAEPGGAGLSWRVESPEGVTARARPLDPAEGGLASRAEGVADSWIVELGTAVAAPLRIRAVRTVPFTSAVAVPLAWVEGATEPGGRVVVAAPPGARPRLENRRLRELPSDPVVAAAPAEYAFGPPQAGSAAELAPVPPGADARAWAWRETVSCWCDESGASESESRFDVENEGRESVSLALAAGRRLESVLVDGAAPPGVEFGPAGGTWRIPLPRGRRRVEIVVRTLAAGRPGRAAWRVEPSGASLDVPVLDRDVRLLVPPGLVIATPVAVSEPSSRPPWTARLFGLGGPAEAESPTGFRSEPVAAASEGGAGVLLVRRGMLASAAILAAVVAGIATFLRCRVGLSSASLLAAVAAVTALWLPAALVPVARAAWWGALVGLACGACRVAAWPTWWRWRPGRAAAAATCILAIVLGPRAAADDAVPRVFITPGDDGGTALVPEPLFRALAEFAAPRSAAVRVCGCRITARRSADAPAWDVTLDVDADDGGTLVLDAGPGARWLPRPGGAGVAVAVGGREARLTAGVAGRHSVELSVAPAVERAGPVETETAWVPVAPATVLEVADAGIATGALACERSVCGGPFERVVAAAGAGAVFDVAGADRVRLVRPVDPRDRLAAGPRSAETVDELAWDGRGCRVEAAIELDAGPDLLRSFVVRADPRLEDLRAVDDEAAPPRLEPLGAGRVRVEFAEAVRGRVRVRLAARMPLADPVGVFEAPGIWVEGLPTEGRTIRLTAADDLEAELDPPPAAGATAADVVGRPPPRVIARRRRPQARAAQSLAVAFAPGGIDLALEAQIDAAAAALVRIPIDVPVGCVVDRVALLADDPADPGAREPVDVAWTRAAADRVLLVVQRPRPGRFRLEVEARLARRPAPRARLPVIRARLATATPLVVSWRAAPPLVVVVEGAAQAGRADTVEIAAGATDPEYVLTTAEEPAPTPAPAPPVAAADEAGRVERAEVRAAFEARGRVHGLARFDVVGAPPVVRLRLPPGMRLFDVLVDGRAAVAEPRATDTWDVPLGAAPWPRTILAVFAGDAGRAVAEGRPLSLAAPRLEGLPAPEVFWSLRPPPGRILRVAPPARMLGAAEAAEVRELARERVGAACERAAAAVAGPERERLEAVAKLRRVDDGPEAEQSWRGAASGPGTGEVVVVAQEPLVIRSVPVADPTLPARAIATVALVAFVGVGWTAVRRRGGGR